MSPERRTFRTTGLPSRQAGMGLVAAIFLVVVVAVLTGAVLRMVRTSATVFAQDVVSHRALLSAESGAELALNRVFAPAGTGSCADRVWPLDDLGLTGCAADVRCSSELVDGELLYTLDSRGRCEVGGTVAERRVLVKAAP